MKFGHFLSYYKKKKKNYQKGYQNATWKLVPGPFVFAKNSA